MQSCERLSAHLQIHLIKEIIDKLWYKSRSLAVCWSGLLRSVLMQSHNPGVDVPANSLHAKLRKKKQELQLTLS